MGRVIDIHTHVFTDAVAPGAISALEQGCGLTATYDGTVAGLLGEMDRAGIDVAVTQPIATKPGHVTKINDWSASIASDRIVPFGTIHPDTPDPGEEIARMASLGLKGMKLHPEYQLFEPDEARMEPVWEAAAEQGMVVLFHAGLDIGLPTDYGRPARFARMIERHPDLTVVLAHMGGWDLWDEVREHVIGLPVHLDTSFAAGYMSDEVFLDLVEAHGVSRVLFGTDGPWADMAAEVRWIRQLPLPVSDIDAILGGNAGRLLGI